MTSSPAAVDNDDVLTDSLVQTSFVVTAALSKIGAESNLSLTQLRVLAILRDRRLGMSALADRLGLERSTMSGLVERAEQRGLLERAPSNTDRRAVDVYLTPDGAELAERLYAVMRSRVSTLVGVLSAAEQLRLNRLLERLLDAPTRLDD